MQVKRNRIIMKFLSILAATAVITTQLVPAAQAAVVPASTKLAEVQELTVDNNAEPASLDPHKVEGVPGGNIIRDLFEGLVNQDADGNIVPGQAESWLVSDDNKVFTFKIRDSARWSDGNPVTAHDFVYSFQRVVDPATASRYSWYIETTTMANAAAIIRGEKPPSTLGVKALDDQRLEVTLEQPVPYFIKMLANATTFPAHRASIEKHGDEWTRPGNMVSNGAYVLDQWVVNGKIVLKRNPKYWNDKETVINQVTYLPITTDSAKLHRYKTGELDMTGTVPLEHYKRLVQKIPDEVVTSPELGTYYYSFNTTKPPMNDVRVRKALSYAINRSAITDYILGQGQKPAYTFTPESVSGFTPPETDYSKLSQKERNQKAAKLIREAGYGPDKPLEVTIVYNTSEGHKKLAIAIAQMWKPLGVKVRLENQEWKTFLDLKRNNRFEIARGGWMGDYNEASSMLDLHTTRHGQNDSRFSNKQYDVLMAKSRTAATDKERNSLYSEAEQILAEEMPVAPIYQYVSSRLIKPYVGGYPVNNVQATVYTKDMYIKAH
ncbi:peptide ABC transporter substrate-binding protein [Endozoicomonas montiporae]|uniref:Peptide ABC transporter substrate-binding protein n=2 Tax=Endozoicomonas montiporae TaxID=1027273 RepID=A0A081N093_9GAMM|nr:peptide ABC transporter substrate-binding protein [Endozoicomonas montiporae]